jgi:hypothetical protein
MDDRELQGAIGSWLREPAVVPDDLGEVLARLSTTPQGRGWLPAPSTRGMRVMMSATRFVVAALIVALFGAFIVTGTLAPGPAHEPQPGALDASPEAARTAAPTPGLELLPGVALDVREVTPGVYRILGDGSHDLTSGVQDVAVSADGDVWVLKTSDAGDTRVLRLGDSGSSYRGPDDALYVELRTLLNGSVHILAPTSAHPDTYATWDGSSWVKPELDALDSCDRAGADGDCWHLGAGSRESIWRITPGGERVEFTADDVGFSNLVAQDRALLERDPDAAGGFTDIAAGPDGSVWAAFVQGDPRTLSLARYDGGTWSVIELDAPPYRAPGWSDIGLAADGTVWAAYVTGERPHPMLEVRAWDGTSWRAFGPVEADGMLASGPTVFFPPDGTIRFGTAGVFDEGTLRTIELPAWPRASAKSIAPDGSVWVAVDTGRETDGLYVIRADQAGT